MKTSRISRLQPGLAVVALFGSMALTTAGLTEAINASPYHRDRLPNGVVTGPQAYGYYGDNFRQRSTPSDFDPFHFSY